MYVLTEVKSGGVYATKNEDGVKSVQVFESEDDAIRYLELLKANEYKTQLEIFEVDAKLVAINCQTHGYAFSIISSNELIIPPSDI